MAQDELTNSTAAKRDAPAIAPAILAGVAAHARASGMFLLMLNPDGSIHYHDDSADGFHQAYTLPFLRQPELSGAEIMERARRLTIESPPQLWDFVPGVLLCAMPCVERRQALGIMLLAAKAERFEPGETLTWNCPAIGIDPHWLTQLASQSPPRDGERLATTTAQLMSILDDRLRLRAMEGEIHSLSSQLANAYEELSLIERVSGGMRVNRGAGDFFHQVCLDVMQVLNARDMGVAMWSEKCRQEPAIFGQTAPPRELLLRLGEQLAPALHQRESFLLINDLAADPAWEWLAPAARQLLAAPLRRGQQTLGCLFALDKTTGDFDSVDAKLLTSIANESAIYLENAVLFGNVNELMMGLLHSLTSAVDAKDAYTCGHSERVALLSRHLALCIGLAEEEIEHVYMAGLLHDVGKIGVPESVLQKAGHLTPEEHDQMKRHPQIGARILQEIRQMGNVVPGVLHHHERYDGHGYPKGLCGREIPLVGRIICLADCFDAMTSSRIYRSALPLEVALNEIRRCSGTQFDPALAEAFLRIAPDQFRLLLKEHADQAKKLLELQETLRAA